MYSLLRIARRRAPLVIGIALLVIGLVYGVGSVLSDEARSVPPARVVFLGIAGLVLIVTGIVQRRAERRGTRPSAGGPRGGG